MAMDEFITIPKKDLDAIASNVITTLNDFCTEFYPYECGLPLGEMHELIEMVKNKLIEKSI